MKEKLKDLFSQAKAAREKSYAPYSSKSVGAALLCKNGRIYQGANIENASYGATLCAERAALTCALMNGDREFSAIAIEGGDINSPAKDFFAPCGICRQALAEFCDGDFTVYILGGGEVREFTLSQLLPEAFSLKPN